MFALRLFAPALFPARYFPEGSGAAPPHTPGVFLLRTLGATYFLPVLPQT